MIANLHTHTWRCNHASGAEEAYVEAGIRRGLKTLGFSDHTPYPFQDGHYSWFRMTMEQFPDYVRTIEALQKKYAGQIALPLGLEAEFYPGPFPELLRMVKDAPVEYLILGQHYIGNELNEPYSGAATGDVNILKRYCRQVMDAMQTGCFTYLAHPDLIHFQGETKVFQAHMRQVCQEAKRCGMPIEYNLLGLKQQRNYPRKDFWELAAEEGNMVVLGCDAHGPESLEDAAIEEEALRNLAGLGIRVTEKIPLRRI